MEMIVKSAISEEGTSVSHLIRVQCKNNLSRREKRRSHGNRE